MFISLSQLQALKSELQLLSEKNRDQAEELQLWRLSAMNPEETLDQISNSSPIVVVREEQLVLSCSPTALHSHTKQSRYSWANCLAFVIDKYTITVRAWDVWSAVIYNI